MRHAPGKNGRLVDTLLPAPPQRPTSWKNVEFQRAEDSSKMPKLWGTAGKPLQHQQLGNDFPDQFLSLTDWPLKHMTNWSDGYFEVGALQDPFSLEQVPLAEQTHPLANSHTDKRRVG